MLIIYVKDYFEKNSETFFKKIHSALKLQNKMGIGMIQVYFNLFLRKYCMSKWWDSNDNLEIIKVTEDISDFVCSRLNEIYTLLSLKNLHGSTAFPFF